MKRRFLLSFLIYAAALLLFKGCCPPFLFGQKNILPEQAGELRSTLTIEGSNAVVRCNTDGTALLTLSKLQPKDRNCQMTVRQPREDGVEAYALSADVQISNVERGKKVYSKTRIIFPTLDMEGRALWNRPHNLFSKTGTIKWKHYKETFILPDNHHCSGSKLMILHQGTSGTMEVRNLSLREGHANVWFHAIRILILTAGLYIGLKFLRNYLRWPQFSSAVFALTAVGITIGVLLPGDLLNDTLKFGGRRVEQVVQKSAPKQVKFSQKTNTKKKAMGKPAKSTTTWSEGEILSAGHHSGHAILFALLAFSAPWALKHKRLWTVPAFILAFILLSEMLQLLTISRSMSLSDTWFDFIGAGIGLFLALAMRGRRSPTTKKC